MVKWVSDKGGWLRVLEASIAILIVLSVLFVVTKQNNVGKGVPSGEDLGILEQIFLDSQIRNEILNYNVALNEDEGVNVEILNGMLGVVAEKLPPDYGYEIKICGALESCDLANDNLETTSEERILSASISKVGNPIKIKLVYWSE